MIPLGEFTFENADALGVKEDLLLQGTETLSVRISRSLRRSPLPGMKQPALNGAIMGMEAVLQVAFKGKPAVGYRWVLYRNGKRVQSGRTGPGGVSGDLEIDLPYKETDFYRVAVFEPPRRKRK